MKITSAPYNSRFVLELPRHAPLIEQSLEAMALSEIYQNCLTKLSESNHRIDQINVRLAKIDPKFVGEKRSKIRAKYYLKRIKKRDEIKNLKFIRKINRNLVAKYSTIAMKVEKDLRRFLDSESPHWISPTRIKNRTFSYGRRVASAAARIGKRLFNRTPPKAISKTTSSSLSPEENRALLLKFMAEMPVFKENPQLQKALEQQFPLIPSIQVKVLNSDRIEIQCPKATIAIDPDLIVSKEECQQIDPENPLIQGEQPIRVNDLKRLGTIDPSWWEWLKEKKYPTFGPRIILERKENTIHFLKGTSLLDALELNEKKVVFKALFLEKACDWDIQDFLSFLRKFKSKRIN